jgi:hypothetical protein
MAGEYEEQKHSKMEDDQSSGSDVQGREEELEDERAAVMHEDTVAEVESLLEQIEKEYKNPVASIPPFAHGHFCLQTDVCNGARRTSTHSSRSWKSCRGDDYAKGEDRGRDAVSGKRWRDEDGGQARGSEL